MPTTPASTPPLRIGLVSISDRASRGDYIDRGLPALSSWLQEVVTSPFELEERLIADEQALIEATLISLCDDLGCGLILTTGGTGPALRDVTPEATLAVAQRVLPGFGEQMRQISLSFVPTAILSRQVAVTRGACLILNLPGQPKAIAETLEGLPASASRAAVPGIFAAVPYCLDLIGAARLDTRPERVASFRPKSASAASAN